MKSGKKKPTNLTNQTNLAKFTFFTFAAYWHVNVTPQIGAESECGQWTWRFFVTSMKITRKVKSADPSAFV